MSHHIVRVRNYRLRWALKQEELAGLLGLSQSAISRIEKAQASPDTALLFGLQVIFGRSPRALFPGLYRRVEDSVMRAAAGFDRTIAGRKDSAAQLKRRLLAAMASRATTSQEQV